MQLFSTKASFVKVAVAVPRVLGNCGRYGKLPMDEMLPLARLGGRHIIRRSRIWVPVIITLMGQESCQKVLIQHFFWRSET